VKRHTLIERAGFYNHGPYGQRFVESQLRASDRWIQGQWVLGNDYRGSGMYGSYPPGYLPRIQTVFPDAARVLHVFSGSLPRAATRALTTLDLRHTSEVVPGVRGSVTALPFTDRVFDLCYADPPYTATDAVQYETPMIDRRRVLYEIHRVIEPGGFLVWMDTTLPMWRKEFWCWCGAIALWRSSNHRVRGVHIFRRLARPGEAVQYDDTTLPLFPDGHGGSYAPGEDRPEQQHQENQAPVDS